MHPLPFDMSTSLYICSSATSYSVSCSVACRCKACGTVPVLQLICNVQTASDDPMAILAYHLQTRGFAVQSVQIHVAACLEDQPPITSLACSEERQFDAVHNKLTHSFRQDTIKQTPLSATLQHGICADLYRPQIHVTS